MKIKNILLFQVLLILAFTLFIINCDNILPDQYEKLGESNVPAIDEHAYNYLTRDTLTYAVSSKEINKLVSSTWADTSDSVIIAEKFDSLMILLDTAYTDTSMIISQAAENGYIFFDSKINGILYCYTTWDLTATNLDVYITIDFYDRQGKKVEQLATNMALETIEKYGTVITDVTGGIVNRHPICKIRSKTKFKLEQAPYLMKVTISNPTLFQNFRLVMLYE